MFLGLLTSLAGASCERWCWCSLLILWLLCSPCPSLMTSLVADLSSTAWTSSHRDGSSQTSDLKTLQRALSFSSPRTMTVLPSGKIYSTWFWSTNLLSDDKLTRLCSPQTPLISAHPDHNDQRLSFDSLKSQWFHHGNDGANKFCWELRHVPSEIGVKPILLFAGVEVSSSLMSNSVQGISHFTPLATTIHVQQVLIMLYSMLSCSHLSIYVVDLKMEIPSSKAYILGIVGLSYIVNAVEGVFTPMSSKFRHQPVSPTSTNVHVRLIQSLARSHSVLEDCSPVALKQKAIQTSSCRGHERSVSFFLERPLLSILGSTLPSTFSLEKVFQRSAVQASRATHFLHSPILAEDQIDLQSITLEALLKKLPVFIYDSNRLTYPFNALMFIYVTSEFHSLAMSPLLVIIS